MLPMISNFSALAQFFVVTLFLQMNATKVDKQQLKTPGCRTSRIADANMDMVHLHP